MKITRDLQKELVEEKIYRETEKRKKADKKLTESLNKKYAKDIKAYKAAKALTEKLETKLDKATGKGITFTKCPWADDVIGFNTFNNSCLGSADQEKIKSLARKMYLEAQSQESPEASKLIEAFLKEKL